MHTHSSQFILFCALEVISNYMSGESLHESSVAIHVAMCVLMSLHGYCMYITHNSAMHCSWFSETCYVASYL